MWLPLIRRVSLHAFSEGGSTQTIRFHFTQGLKVHVVLNVGHQRGCEVVTSGTSLKINVFFFRRGYDL